METIPTEDMFTINTHDLCTTGNPFERITTLRTTFDIRIGFQFVRCTSKRQEILDENVNRYGKILQQIRTMFIWMPLRTTFQTKCCLTLDEWNERETSQRERERVILLLCKSSAVLYGFFWHRSEIEHNRNPHVDKIIDEDH